MCVFYWRYINGLILGVGSQGFVLWISVKGFSFLQFYFKWMIYFWIWEVRWKVGMFMGWDAGCGKFSRYFVDFCRLFGFFIVKVYGYWGFRLEFGKSFYWVFGSLESVQMQVFSQFVFQYLQGFGFFYGLGDVVK